jgi:hypothetical protein
MPFGAGPAIRLAFVHTKPWQTFLICVAMIAGGAFLVALGHVAGVVLAVAGCLMTWRMIQYRLRSRKEGRRSESADSN